MATSKNSGNLEYITEDYIKRYKTPEVAGSLLRDAIVSFELGKYASAGILAGLAQKIYGDLGDRWHAHIAKGWYKSSERKLQTQHQ